MELSQAIAYHADDALDGWDGMAWVENIVCGSLLTYDRFISARSFGEKKRLFLTGKDTGRIDEFPVVRTQAGIVFIITSKNSDIDLCPSGYANIYALTRADYQADIIQLTTTTAASGTKRGLTRETAATHYCDLERFSNRSATDIPDLTYSQVRFTFPGTAVINTDDEIQVNGILYDVKEVERLMLSVGVYAYKRSGENI